jgi:hypothetical protein
MTCGIHMTLSSTMSHTDDVGSKTGASRVCILAGALAVSIVVAGSSSATQTTNRADLTQQGLIHLAFDSASYTVSPETGGPRTRFIATVQNTGLSTIEYGHGFRLAVRTDDGWRRLRHGPCAFTDEALLMRPGDSVSERVGWLRSNCSFRALAPGSYRVSKRIRFTDYNGWNLPRREDRARILRAFFHVEAD